MFATETYVDRRRRLASQFTGGLLLFLGNEESPMNYEANTYPFRQDSTFLYYFGADDPGLAAVVDIDEGRETVFGDELTMDDIIWAGFLPTLADRAVRSGVGETLPATALAEYLKKASSGGRAIRFLPPYRPENRIRLAHLLGVSTEGLSEAASVEMVRAVVEMRAVKSEEEVLEIGRAVDTSADMHKAAMRVTKPGMKEKDVVAKVTEIALAGGGGLSFPVIATVHGETLHNHHYGNTLNEGDLFLLDCGAETSLRYAGDLTSTFPVGKTFTQMQKDVYGAVLAVHGAVEGLLRPGVPFRDAHALACRTIASGMKDLGLMKGDLGEAVAQGAHALFFPHGLGHMMGLDVHDMEDLGELWVGYEGKPRSSQFGLKSLRLARELKPGFAFTVEPGVYFIPQLIDRWEAEGKFTDFLVYDKIKQYKGFGGVRIEEDFVVTESGIRRLGRSKPRTVEEVEAARA